MPNKKFVSKAHRVSLQQFFAYCVQHNLPFAFYRLPGTKAIKVVAQHNSNLLKVNLTRHAQKAGFLFAPFTQTPNAHSVLIRPDIYCTAASLPRLNFAPAVQAKFAALVPKLKNTGRRQYEGLVKNIKQFIASGKARKVIAARVLTMPRPAGFNEFKLFTALCNTYAHAFVSLVFTPQYGLWVGASPEVLLTAANNRFTTYSLAGTKANTPANLKAGWGGKEVEEQAIVSRYIGQSVAKVIKQPAVVKGPVTTTAGNLLHLLTTFTYNNVPADSWPQMVKALHPTPAVAGLPQRTAIQFITKAEPNPRSFYSGYLGPVNLGGRINLFVNLRCMQVFKNKLAIYVGCGITADSEPAKEWNETGIKSQTLLNVIAGI